MSDFKIVVPVEIELDDLIADKSQEHFEGVAQFVSEDLGEVRNGVRALPNLYDSLTDSIAHIQNVQIRLSYFISELVMRSMMHDRSKLHEPEKSFYDQWRPVLAALEYGSPEYLEAIEQLKPALHNHYNHNRHHPEYHHYWECGGCFAYYSYDASPCPKCRYTVFKQTRGVDGMTLLDLLEMLCDWVSSPSQDIARSIEVGKERYHIGEQLARILQNTARDAGWME